MFALLGQGTAVVAIPGIQHSLVGVAGHHAGLVEGGHGVVCFPAAVLVQWHEVDSPPGRIVFLWDADHATAPGGGGPTGHLLQDANCHIPVKTGLNLLVPVERNRDGGVAGDWCHTLLDVDLDWGAMHGRELLTLTAIEGGCCIIFPNPLLKLGDIVWCWSKWKSCRDIWGPLSHWALTVTVWVLAIHGGVVGELGLSQLSKVSGHIAEVLTGLEAEEQ